jgi:hypothetical protein
LYAKFLILALLKKIGGALADTRYNVQFGTRGEIEIATSREQ